jgi:hypothetical protein
LHHDSRLWERSRAGRECACDQHRECKHTPHRCCHHACVSCVSQSLKSQLMKVHRCIRCMSPAHKWPQCCRLLRCSEGSPAWLLLLLSSHTSCSSWRMTLAGTMCVVEHGRPALTHSRIQFALMMKSASRSQLHFNMTHARMLARITLDHARPTKRWRLNVVTVKAGAAVRHTVMPHAWFS